MNRREFLTIGSAFLSNAAVSGTVRSLIGANGVSSEIEDEPAFENPYIIDNHCAIWDGWTYVGATEWVDAFGGEKATLSNMQILEGSVRSNYQGMVEFPKVLDATEQECTLEIAFKFHGALASDQRIFCSPSGNWTKVPMLNYSSAYTMQMISIAGGDAMRIYSGESMFLNYTASFVKSTKSLLYTNGLFYRSGSTPFNNPTIYQSPIYWSRNNIDVEIFSVRIYNRALTSAEVAYNYSIDKMRFGI